MKNLQKNRRILVSAVMERGGISVAQKEPDKGVFAPVFWQMHYYGTGHTGRLYTQYSSEHGCAIRASVIAEGTDREISNYVFFGSKEECLAWLKEEAHVEELIEIYNHLVEKAEDML